MYARTGAGPPVSVTLGPKRLPSRRRLVVLRDADAADDAAGADDADGLLVGRQVADRLEDDRAAAVGEVADLGDPVGAALGDHVGGAELTAEVGPRLVAAHQHDALGAELLGRQHGEQADGAVADHGDGAAGLHAAADSGVPAGAVDVGEGQQARPAGSRRCPRSTPGTATRVPSASGTRTASACPPPVPGPGRSRTRR